ncbi:unnamed protein product [Kuraishia capsulata CBS 1993]|uniref:Lysophospholipid acyltransferase n=1 Tax=Kuraishia capsulata CBS 1993 TaxID=1382522 RepID=W6MKN2_9ASCO|nr:uncharacterized protein KUCA_T00002540001 [Kuraishia capsulata CBS 1993]CDK26568.1 unnamed protein product [Kuraishia capsulata CBS 1993]
MPWVNLCALMGFLCFNHLKAQFFEVFDASKMDITGAQMVLVMKLSSFGWSYQDGQLLISDPKKFNSNLNTYQKSRAVTNHPTFLSFVSYAFFFPALVTGPAFDYADYEKFIMTDLFEDVPQSKRPGRRRKRKIPRSGRIAAKKVVGGLFWAALWMVLKPRLNVDMLLSQSFVTDHSFLYRIFFLWILGFVHRLKYYAVWSIAEGGCILVGIGYNGYDKKKDKFYWNRVQNIDIFAFETGQNCHACLEAWNQNTNKWLKNYVYLRTVTKRDPKTGKLRPGFISTFITFLTSAFWHGTMPGYYLTFVVGSVLQATGKIYRRNFRPMFITADESIVSPYKPLYDIVCYLVTQLAFGYTVQPFVILEFKKSLQAWSTVYFYIHIGSIITLLVFDGPYKKKVIELCAKYHYVAAKIPETPEIPVKPTVVEQIARVPVTRLEKPEDGSASVSADEGSIPDYDDQEELHDDAVPALGIPELDKFKEDFDEFRIEKDLPEWFNEDGSSKEAMIRAFEELREDARSMLHNTTSSKPEKKD